MKQKLFLHIGVPKTGTTSIQESFFRSTDALHRNNALYLPYADRNHSPAMMWFFCKKERKLAYHVTVKQRLTARQVDAKCTEIQTLLDGFLQDPAQTKIISGEDISDLAEDEIVNMKNYFEKVREHDIKIIVYVRNYYQFLDSRVQQRVKNAISLRSIEEFAAKGKLGIILPEYRDRISKVHKRLWAEERHDPSF